MPQLHAQPYDIAANGFYFESLEEYTDKADSNRNDYGDPVEEYEIQFIDGDLPLVLHLGFVALVSALPQWFPGWVVHKLPAPMDDWQGQIIPSLFGPSALARVLRR